jgi:hypothetical protein
MATKKPSNYGQDKLYLDDTRKPPNGWWIIRSTRQAIRLIRAGRVEVISLDYDLGERRKNGCAVLDWLHKQVYLYDFKPPKILIHTMNPVGRQKMEKIKALIEKESRAGQGDI